MADINLTFGDEGLNDLKKDLNQILKIYQKIKAEVDDKNMSEESAALKAKKIYSEQLKVENSIKRQETAAERLNTKQKEQLGILGKLEKEARDFRSAMKSAQSEAEFKKAQTGLRQTQKRMRDLKDATNTWSKALGSFQFKFNALGNIMANVLSGVSNRLNSIIREFISFEKIIQSNQATADKYDQTMAKLRGGIDALSRAIALGDFSGLADEMERGARAAEDYAIAMDVLGDTQNALDIQTAKSKLRFRELKEVITDTSVENEKRLEAAIEAEALLIGIQEKQEDIAKQRVKAEIQRVQTTFGLTEEQAGLYQRFLENYGLLTDAQVTSLETLEAKAVETIDTEKGMARARRQNILAQATGARMGDVNRASQEAANETINEGQKALADYNKVSKELSETIGFDVNPIMEALVGTNDEQRRGIVQSIIAMAQQIDQTQALRNENNRLIATIQTAIEAQDNLNSKRAAAIQIDPDDIIEDILTDADDILDKYNKKTEESALERNRRLRALFRARLDWEDKEQEKAEKKKGEIFDESLAQAQTALQAFSSIFEAQKQKELNAAGDNAEAREKIEKEYLKKEQNLAVGEALVNGAVGVTKVLRQYAGNPVAQAIFTALTVASTAAQVAAIKAQKFEKGGEVGGYLHSQGGTIIEAERGEYVINRKSTAKHKGLIEGINEDDHVKILSAMGQDRRINIQTDPFTKKIYDLMRSQESYGETNEYYVVQKGTQKTLIRKH